MKILYLSYYYEPDLSAGSFRNTTLSRALSINLNDNGYIYLITAMTNCLATYSSVGLLSQ
jgi:hypothetical protein